MIAQLNYSAVRLSISPDPNVPNLVVGVEKNGRLLLCVYDYKCAAEKGYNEVDIGKTDYTGGGCEKVVM